MTTIAILMVACALVLFALLGLFIWLQERTPVDREEDAVESEFNALTVIDAATAPAPLTWNEAYTKRPRVRAGEAK